MGSDSVNASAGGDAANQGNALISQGLSSGLYGNNGLNQSYGQAINQQNATQGLTSSAFAGTGAAASNVYNPYASTGAQANTALAQLSGVGGNTNTLQNFAQSAPYQALFGNAPLTGNSLQNYLNTPGYQYQYQQMMNSTGMQNAASGNSGSGQLYKALQSNAQGLADTNFGNYQTLLGNTYNSYMQQLSGNLNNLSSQGLTAAGGQSNALLTTGKGMAEAYQNAGNNISELLANQGSANLSAQLNSAAGQANNLLTGAGIDMQGQSANQQSSDSLMSSVLGGALSLFGGFV